MTEQKPNTWVVRQNPAVDPTPDYVHVFEFDDEEKARGWAAELGQPLGSMFLAKGENWAQEGHLVRTAISNELAEQFGWRREIDHVPPPERDFVIPYATSHRKG